MRDWRLDEHEEAAWMNIPEAVKEFRAVRYRSKCKCKEMSSVDLGDGWRRLSCDDCGQVIDYHESIASDLASIHNAPQNGDTE